MPAPNLQAVQAAITAQVQLLQDAIQQVGISRLLDHAYGEQLDMLGEWLGRKRLELDDATYRARLRIQIAINNSSGTPPELIRLLKSISGAATFAYREYYPASIRPILTGITEDPAVILEAALSLKSGGVSIMFEIAPDYVPFRAGDKAGDTLGRYLGQ